MVVLGLMGLFSFFLGLMELFLIVLGLVGLLLVVLGLSRLLLVVLEMNRLANNRADRSTFNLNQGTALCPLGIGEQF